MGQSIRHIKNRIRGIENTQKVTQAMQFVSAAKLSRIDKLLANMKPYYLAIEPMIHNLVSATGELGLNFPYFNKKINREKITLFLAASDTGLCSGYNTNVIKIADNFIREKGKDNVKLVVLGKKAYTYYNKQGIEIVKCYLGLNGKFTNNLSEDLTNFLTNTFISNKTSEIYIIYTHFTNLLAHHVRIEKFLELTPKIGKAPLYIFEPSAQDIVDALVKKHLAVKIKLALLNSFTCEHAARTVAMKAATDNAKEILHTLKIEKNKIRQTLITQEIMEIISSSEALKG